MVKLRAPTSTDDLFNFDSLKLVDKPDSPKNSQTIKQTLEGCEGYLQHLPLRAPNVDQKNPKTVADMVNILTNPEAFKAFCDEEEKLSAAAEQARTEGMPSAVYDYKDSPVMRAQLRQGRKQTSHTKAPGVLGHVVQPGCISFYKRDGKTYAVTEGRWMLTSVKAKWISKNISLDHDKIIPNDSKVMMIRVPPGCVGRIRDQGVEYLLDAGRHVFNSGTVTDCGTVSYADNNYFNHGRYHYIRVPRGYFARVWVEVKNEEGIVSVQPRLLEEGEHFVDSHLCKYDGMVNVSDEYIHHGSIHRIAVEKGKVAKVWHDNRPRLLGEGDHIVESSQFSFKGMVDVISNPCIVHGTITILRVTLGQIALAWKDSEPTFFDRPGLYEFDSPDFVFVETRDAGEQLIQLGAKKIVLVLSGEVAVTFDKGQLKILPDGRHLIESSTWIFHRFLSTQQKSIRLASLAADEKLARKFRQSSKASWKEFKEEQERLGQSHLLGPDSDLTICETKDLVKVGLRADVFYSIEDPEKCIQKIDTDELEDLVRETAVAALTNIIRSTALNQIAQSKTVSVSGGGDSVSILQPPGAEGNPPATAPTAVFFERVHDEFLSKLHDDFYMRYGVDIANIRIESFKIMDEELSEQISKHALTTAQIENEMANLEGRSLISTTQERTAAEVKSINAEAEAAALKVTADAENQRKIDASRATAESQKIAIKAKAEAEAEAILVKAKAEAEAIRLKAAAEAERAEVLSRTTLGQQEALLSQYSEMVIESNRGVEKVVYLDPSVNRESPFALGSLQNLNYDLHSLSKLGIAAGEASGQHGKQ